MTSGGAFDRRADAPPPASGRHAGPGRPRIQVSRPALWGEERLPPRPALLTFAAVLLACAAGLLARPDPNAPSASQGARPLSPPDRGPAAPVGSTDAAAARTTLADEPALEADTAERNDVAASAAGGGEATVRAFYDALGAGDGEAASARVVAEKRSSRAFSPAAISRFYGGLAEPLRLTDVTPIGPAAFRVRYGYSAGRSRCDGEAVVRLTTRAGRDYIRSIRSLSGC